MPYPVMNTIARRGLPEGRPQLLEVDVLQRAQRRRDRHLRRELRERPFDDERHGLRALPRRGDPGRRTETAWPHRQDGFDLSDTASGSTRRRPTRTSRGRDRCMRDWSRMPQAAVRQLPRRRRRRRGCCRVRPEPRATCRCQASLRPRERLPPQPQHLAGDVAARFPSVRECPLS